MPPLICFYFFFVVIISKLLLFCTIKIGQPAVLSLVPKAKQVTLIGALSAEGFVYHELLNADGTKAKGVGADKFCLFLGSLSARLPRDSVVIMDNAPIHQGEQFEEV